MSSPLENEDTTVGVAQKCLFCAAQLPLPPSFIIVDGQVTHLKKETADDDEDGNGSPLPHISTSPLSFHSSSEEPPLHNKQLQVTFMFILRKILHIPKRQLSTFLAKYERQLHQGQDELWTQVCTSCGEEVRQFYVAFQEISLLRRKLNRISNQMKARIHNTTEDVKWERGGKEPGIWREIRGLLLHGKTEHDFDSAVKTEQSLPDLNEGDQDDPECIVSSSSSSSPSSSGRTSPDFDKLDEISNDSHSDSNSEEYKAVFLKPESDIPSSTTSSPQKRELDRPRKSSSSLKPKRRRRDYFFACPKCPASCRTTTFLKAHLKLHDKLETNSSAYDCTSCKKCGWVLRSKTLQRHMREYHAKGKKERLSRRVSGLKTKGIPYYCDYCQMIYVKRTQLQNHFVSYHANKVGFRRCQEEKCTDEFESEQLLNFHLKTIHKKVKKENPSSEEEMNQDQNCPHCDKILKSKLEVDYHIAENHQDILLTCKSCNVKFKNYCQYQKHMDTKMHATSHPFTCELCGKIYWTENHLNLHRRQEHFEALGMVPFSCKLCGKILCDQKYLDNHMKLVHENEKKFACEFCGKGFTQRNNLRLHLKAFHEGPLVNNPGGIPQGKHYSNSEEGKFVCEFCSETFLTLQHVRKHLLSKHFNEIKYCCEACPKKFCAWTGLHNHRKICVELKKINGDDKVGKKEKFTCELCSKSFNRPKAVKEHRRKVHKDAFEHKCCECDKVFSNLAKLTSHRITCVAKGRDGIMLS